MIVATRRTRRDMEGRRVVKDRMGVSTTGDTARVTQIVLTHPILATLTVITLLLKTQTQDRLVPQITTIKGTKGTEVAGNITRKKAEGVKIKSIREDTRTRDQLKMLLKLTLSNRYCSSSRCSNKFNSNSSLKLWKLHLRRTLARR